MTELVVTTLDNVAFRDAIQNVAHPQMRSHNG